MSLGKLCLMFEVSFSLRLLVLASKKTGERNHKLCYSIVMDEMLGEGELGWGW